eukprot:6851972-Prymnesium_polylepis.1
MQVWQQETQIVEVDSFDDTFTALCSTQYGRLADNPTDPSNLTDHQKSKSIEVVYENASEVDIRYAVGCCNNAGRNFLVSGESDLLPVCPKPPSPPPSPPPPSPPPPSPPPLSPPPSPPPPSPPPSPPPPSPPPSPPPPSPPPSPPPPSPPPSPPPPSPPPSPPPPSPPPPSPPPSPPPEPPPSPPPPIPPPCSPTPSPPPPLPPPPPPPTPNPPPVPLHPGEQWGAYLVELNFTYPGTKSILECGSDLDGTGCATDTEKAVQVPVGTTTASSVPSLLVDLNKDSRLDLVTGTVVYLNDAAINGDFTRALPLKIGNAPIQVKSIVAVDVDADTNIDLVVAFQTMETTPLKQSGIKVFLNPGDGDFSTVTPLQVGSPDQLTQSVVVSDVNADDLVDIIAGNTGTTNKVYLNRGTVNYWSDTTSHILTAIEFGAETDDTTAVEVGDVNGDSLKDLIVANSNGASK